MTAWIGGEVWWLGAPFGLATVKDIGKKRIMIGRDCGFFVVVEFDHHWEMIGIVVVYWVRDEGGTRGLDA